MRVGRLLCNHRAIGIGIVAIPVCVALLAGNAHGATPAVSKKWKALFTKKRPFLEIIFKETHNVGDQETVYHYVASSKDSFVSIKSKRPLSFDGDAVFDVERHKTFFGRHEDSYWLIRDNDAFLLENIKIARQGEAAELRRSFEERLLLEASSLLNVGLYNAEINEIHWNEQGGFQGTNVYGHAIAGKILETHDGLPTRLKYMIHVEDRKYTKYFEYDYNFDGPVPYHPRAIAYYDDQDLQEVGASRTEVVDIRKSNSDERLFSVYHWLKPEIGRFSTYVFPGREEGELYNPWRHRRIYIFGSWWPQSTLSYVFYGVFFMLAVSVMIYILRRKNKGAP